MKILTKVAAILMVASALLSCKKEPVNNVPNEPEKPDQPNVEVEIEYTEDIEFSIKVLSVDATTAEIEVEHTGTEDDTWYGFATTSTNIKVAIMDMVAELTENDDEKLKTIHPLRFSERKTLTERRAPHPSQGRG